jgi:hypothetical protein
MIPTLVASELFSPGKKDRSGLNVGRLEVENFNLAYGQLLCVYNLLTFNLQPFPSP